MLRALGCIMVNEYYYSFPLWLYETLSVRGDRQMKGHYLTVLGRRMRFVSTDNCFNGWVYCRFIATNHHRHRPSIILTPRHRAAIRSILNKAGTSRYPECGKCQSLITVISTIPQHNSLANRADHDRRCEASGSDCKVVPVREITAC